MGGKMRGARLHTRDLVVGLMCAVLCWGCATAAPGTDAAGTAGATQAQGSQADQSPKSPVPPKQVVKIVSVQMQEGPEEAQIRLVGTGPFHDYEFQRMGDMQFSLDLGDVSRSDPLPSLPVGQGQVDLSYADLARGNGVALVGSLRSPLDRYVVNSDGNDLVLSVYFSQPLPAKATPTRSSKQAASSGSKGKRQSVAAATDTVESRRMGPASAVSQKTASSNPASARNPNGQDRGEGGGEPGVTKPQFSGKPISLDLLDADLRNVLRLLADISGTNMVIEPDVTGRVTLKVDQVPWDQVLDMVLSMNDLGKEQAGGVVRIAKRGKLKQEWTQQADQIRAQQELLEIARDLGDVATVYFTVNYAKPSEIAAKIAESKSDRGKVSIDERTSLVIYSDYPARIEKARQLLARLDKPTSQVIIEARIVTVRVQSSKDLGITWNLTTTHTTTDPGLTQSFVVDVPTPSPSSFAFSMGQLIDKTLLQVDATISALETMGKSKVIAAPKVLTLNNVKAVISQGTQIPYLKLNEQGVTSTEFKDATVELAVTPHITPDRKVRLQINAKQDEPGATFNGQTGIDTRKINTELLVEDGNIVVIGGVMRNTESKTIEETPGLAKIPLLGALFKHKNEQTDKVELLIFICPKIVEAATTAQVR